MKQAKIICKCGRTILTSYMYKDDVWLNRVDCACGNKFVPVSAYFPYEPTNEEEKEILIH